MSRHLLALGVLLLTALTQGQAAGSDQSAEPATASQSFDPQELLTRMVGRWTLTGVIAKQNTVHNVEVSRALQRNYVRITEVSRERDENGQPRYEAIVFIGWAKDHYTCFWLDNTEVASGGVTCAAARAAHSIPLEFRDAKGALIFTNTFTYQRATDSWDWRMDNVHDGKAVTFGVVTLHREPAR